MAMETPSGLREESEPEASSCRLENVPTSNPVTYIRIPWTVGGSQTFSLKPINWMQTYFWSVLIPSRFHMDIYGPTPPGNDGAHVWDEDKSTMDEGKNRVSTGWGPQDS